MDKITFIGDEGDKIELFVLESTRLGAVDYVLATDAETGDGECYILKDTAPQQADESVYVMVDDEKELDYLVNVFAELVEDVDIDF